MSHHRPIRLALILLTLASAPALAAPIVRTLPNGITLVVDEMHSSPVAAVRFYVRAGAVYEDRYLGAGISHFLEHLIGHGSTTRTSDEIDRLQEEMGNQANAYTTADHTCYHMTSSARFTDDVINLVADYLFHPLLDPTDVDTQRGIILREMAMGDDDPGRRLYELLNQTMFRIHPQRYRVIGYPERFRRISRDDILSYYDRMYSPENVVAVVVGDFDAQHVLFTLQQVLADIPRRGVSLPALPVEPPQIGERRVVEIAPDLARAYLAIGFRTVDLFHPDLYPLDVLAYILTNGASSRLVSRLRDQEGIVDSVDAFSATPVYDAGCFAISATLSEDKLPAAEKAILAELDRLAKDPVPLPELDRAKQQKAAELVYARSSAESWAETLGGDFLATGDVNFSQRYVESIRRVKPADLLAAARRYFRPDNRTVVIRCAGKATGLAASPQAAERPRTLKQSLPNGITLLIRPDHRAPMVNVQVAFRGGLRYETDQTAGVGQILAAMLRRGTTTRSRLAIAQTLDAIGAEMGASSGRNSLTVSGTALSANLDTLLTLIADCVRHPSFPPDELDRVRALQLNAIKAQQDDPDELTLQLLRDALFQGHPYKLNPLGTEASVTALDRDSLVAHYTRIVAPQGMVIAIGGEVDPRATRALVDRLFADWSRPEPTPVTLAPPAYPDGLARSSQVRNQQQAIICFGFPGPRVDSPDRFALDVLDAAFSGIGIPGGRLHRRLRGDQLVYATHMVPIPGLDPAYVYVYAATAPDKLDTVETTIKELIAQVQESPLTDDELDRARRMCIAAHDVGLDSTADSLLQQTLDELYGLGFDASGQYAQRITEVSAQDVLAAAHKYLDLQHCAVAITRPDPDTGAALNDRDPSATR